MSDARKSEKSEMSSGQKFPATRWSMIVSASDSGEDALEELCRIYWRPIYGFLRRSGSSHEDAEDVTQSFLAKLIQSGSLSRADREKGKLRSFLLGALKHHLADRHRFDHREKRGGGAKHLPLVVTELDFENAEHHYIEHPVEEKSPDLIFDQSWAINILRRAHERVEQDYQTGGKLQEYQCLKPALATTREIDAEAAARSLGVAPGTVRVLVHRLRQNFRAALRDEVADTVTTREEVTEELRYLLEVFAS